MSIPNLNEIVLKALDYFSSELILPLHLTLPDDTLVIASGNALSTGKILFRERNFVYCNEGTYQSHLDSIGESQAAIVISSSGEKHSINVLKNLINKAIPSYLLTCNEASTSASLLPKERVFKSPSILEPPTYNTSTYLGMILAQTKEKPIEILNYIQTVIVPLVKRIGEYRAYYILIPPGYELLAEMFVTKFDELFGGRINGRCYTTTQTMHAKTVVPWNKELFISFGVENKYFGTQRLHIPLYEGASFAAMLAIGYYIVGQIQTEKPPWFIENIENYSSFQKSIFMSESISPPSAF